MQKETLLTEFVDNKFVPPYENVANCGVCYLLNQYTEARDVLKYVLEMNSVPSRYATERQTESGGRPDVTGKDTDGNKTVMIEGKFGASLTDNQPNDYLANLADGGKLLFLCPQARQAELQAELKQRAGGKYSQIVIMQWLDLLGLMEVRARKNSNSDMISDLFQLSAFCKKVDCEFAPSLSDTSPEDEEAQQQFHYLLKRCRHILKAEPTGLADFSRPTKWAPSTDGFGFYFYVGSRIECFVHFSNKKWRKHDTPLWLGIKWDREEKKKERKRDGTEKFAAALKNLEPKNTDGNDIKIITTVGTDDDKVVNEIVIRVNKILTDIKEKFPND